ncbi:MAG: GAF domain-containing protein, partial [Acidobacteriaceae bacterium]
MGMEAVQGAKREQELTAGRQVELLLETGLLLAGEHDLEKVVQAATDAACELAGAQFGAFFHNVTDAAGESLMLFTLSGIPREAFAGFPMPRNTAVFGPTFRGEEAVRSEDITEDPRYGHNTPFRGMPEGHPAVRSYMSVPVISRSGEVLGGMFFGHAAAGVFSADKQKLVANIAAQAAIAIENSRLNEELR